MDILGLFHYFQILLLVIISLMPIYKARHDIISCYDTLYASIPIAEVCMVCLAFTTADVYIGVCDSLS